MTKLLSILLKEDVRPVQMSRFIHTSTGGVRQQVKEKYWDYNVLPQVEVPDEDLLFRGMDTDFPCVSKK